MKFSSFSVGLYLVITGILVTCNIYTLIPLYEAIGNQMAISSNQVAVGSMSFTFFYACGLLFFGNLADYLGRKRVIVAGLLLSSLSTLLVTFSDNPTMLYVFRGMQGFTLASFAPVAFAYSFEYFKNVKVRTLWIALINAGFLCAGMIGQVISTFLLSIGNWQLTFYIISCLYLLLFFIGALFMPKTEAIFSKRNFILESLVFLQILKNKNLAMCYLIVVTLLFSFVGFYEALSYQFSNAEENTIMLQAAGLIGVSMSVFAGKFHEKYGSYQTLLGGILLGWGSALLLLYNPEKAAVGFLSIFFVASIALLIPTIIHLIGTLSENLVGKAISLYSFILLVGASLGSLVASLFTYRTFLIILLLLFSFQLGIALLLKKAAANKETNTHNSI